MARSTTFKLNITVVNPGSGNKYYIDGILQSYVTLNPGCTYEFNQDDSTNGGHPLRFSTTSDGSHGGGSEYTTGVTTSGTQGSGTAFTKIEVTSSTPFVLYTYCTQHSGMGGYINVPNNIPAAGIGDIGLFMGGNTPSNSNVMDFVNISVSSNATDYGDLVAVRNNMGAASNGHGGLS